jgi:hypothetical protein
VVLVAVLVALGLDALLVAALPPELEPHAPSNAVRISARAAGAHRRLVASYLGIRLFPSRRRWRKPTEG